MRVTPRNVTCHVTVSDISCRIQRVSLYNTSLKVIWKRKFLDSFAWNIWSHWNFNHFSTCFMTPVVFVPKRGYRIWFIRSMNRAEGTRPTHVLHHVTVLGISIANQWMKWLYVWASMNDQMKRWYEEWMNKECDTNWYKYRIIDTDRYELTMHIENSSGTGFEKPQQFSNNPCTVKHQNLKSEVGKHMDVRWKSPMGLVHRFDSKL